MEIKCRQWQKIKESKNDISRKNTFSILNLVLPSQLIEAANSSGIELGNDKFAETDVINML